MPETQTIIDLQKRIADLTDQSNEQLHNMALLRMQLHHLQQTLEMVPVGVVLADQNGRILHGNSRVEQMVRHPVLMSENTGQYAEWVCYHADGRLVESHEYPLSRVLNEGEEEAQLDCHYQRGDGTMFWMRILGRPIYDDNRAKIGAAVALIDVDEEIRRERQHRTMISELNHRVKNAFAVVKAIVSQSLRKANVAQDLRNSIESRLEAYGNAHAKLVGSTWDDTALYTLAHDITSAFGDGRIFLQGPHVVVHSRAALALSMAFYELCTNALKYGSLSVPAGRVDLNWHIRGENLHVQWAEKGGEPAVEPKHKGFGSFIIDRAVAADTNGQVTLDYEAGGLRWTLIMPLKPQH